MTERCSKGIDKANIDENCSKAVLQENDLWSSTFPIPVVIFQKNDIKFSSYLLEPILYPSYL